MKRQPGGGRLKAYLLKRGQTQRAMALQLGITDAHMSDIIHGKETPGLALAVRIEDATGIPTRTWVAVQKMRAA